MAGLTLPFVVSDTYNENLFWITLTSGGGTAIEGDSFGTDQFGDSGTGVGGQSDVGQGVYGASQSGRGVVGISQSGQGVSAASTTGIGLLATAGSDLSGFGFYAGAAIQAFSNVDGDVINATGSSGSHAAVSGTNNAGGYGVWASSTKGQQGVGGIGLYATGALHAAQFDGHVLHNGDVHVTGDVVLINGNGDVAEDFDVEPESPAVEPGTVLVINENGNVCTSEVPYDTRVAGVVAGAGEFKPALVLQRVPSQKPRLPIALIGKVFCKVDATFGKITAGDLLTTAPTPGHAMRATDKSRAVGAIVGKALASLDAGIGLIPILVSPR